MALSRAAALLLLALAAALPAARAAFGDAFVADLKQATANQNNGGTYKDVGKGYGTGSVIDTNTAYSWEVDLFDVPGVPAEIELALALPGLPRLLLLTDAPQPDGVSFGLIEYQALADAIAASPNPAASLKDGKSVVLVAKFADPAGSALLGTMGDGSTATEVAPAPLAADAVVIEATDRYAQHPGVDPEIFFSQLDGLQTYILESGLTVGGNGTGSVLLYYWPDTDTYDWDLELNGVASPEYMQLRIFNDLKDQPVLFNMTPTQPWDPSTISYSGSFTAREFKAALERAGRPEGTLHNHTPDIFLDLYDAGGVSLDAQISAEQSAQANETTGGAALAAVRRRRLHQGGAELLAAAPAPADGYGLAPALAPGDALAGLGAVAAGGAGSCAAVQQESRLLGFLFDANTRYKLKPVLKDTTSLPSTITDIPLYVSAGLIGAFGLFFVAAYIAGMLEEAKA